MADATMESVLQTILALGFLLACVYGILSRTSPRKPVKVKVKKYSLVYVWRHTRRDPKTGVLAVLEYRTVACSYERRWVARLVRVITGIDSTPRSWIELWEDGKEPEAGWHPYAKVKQAEGRNG